MILSGGILVEQNVQCADNLMSFQHYVIDAALARMQGRIPLEVLIQRLPNLRIVPEQEIVYLPSILIREFTKFLIQ